MQKASYWIERLGLEKHPEGGYYREVYRAAEEIEKRALPKRYNGPRNIATSIYFLLEAPDVSKFHRIKSDETWHFYIGDEVEIFFLDETGKLNSLLLGSDISRTAQFQQTIPANHWFGAKLSANHGFALMGCTVAPGFHFDDFELARRDELIDNYPDHKELICSLT